MQRPNSLRQSILKSRERSTDGSTVSNSSQMMLPDIRKSTNPSLPGSQE